MPRLSFLAAPALALALAVPASAQESVPDSVAVPADSVLADSVLADSAAAEATISPDPERARELYEEGRTALTSQNYEEALAQFDQALLYNDAYAVAALGRGQALAQLGRLEDSRSALEAAVAMAESSDAANAADVVRTTQRYLDQINRAIESRAANAAQQQQAEAAQAAASEAEATNQKVEEAIAILQANEVTEAQAIDAYALLEQARIAGYDTDQIAFYYAKALNAMNRGADAIPYAETALAQSEGQDDRSLYYIQLGIANMEAGNAAEARAAFEAISEGQAWHGWAQHYLRELDQS